MFHCDYTGNTAFNFDTRCSSPCTNINFVGIYPQNKIERALSCNGTMGNQWVQFYLPEIVDIPEQKPDIEGIVGIHSCVEIISQRVIRTPQVTPVSLPDGTVIPGQDIENSEGTNLTGKKLIIEGILKEKIIYTALEATQSLHSASFCIPFSVFIVIDGTTPLNACLKVETAIEDVYACQLSERSVFKNTTIFIKADPIC